MSYFLIAAENKIAVYKSNLLVAQKLFHKFVDFIVYAQFDSRLVNCQISYF